MSILNTWTGDKWSSCQSIISTLLTICSLLSPKPLLNEPGHTEQAKDFIPYQKSIEFKNFDFAMCEFIQRPDIIPHPFELFTTYMKDRFIDNYDKTIAIIDKHIDGDEEPTVERVAIYNMKTVIDYKLLKIKIANIKLTLC